MSRYTRTYDFDPKTRAKGEEVKFELDAIEVYAAEMPEPETYLAGSLNILTAGGTANAITVSADTTWASYTGKSSYRLSVKITTINTGAVTLNVDSVGATPCVRADGVALAAGDLVANATYDFVYSEELSKFFVGAYASILVTAQESATASAASAVTSSEQAAISTAQAVLSADQVALAAGQVALATTQADNSGVSATLAQNWAVKMGGPVSAGEYSAKYWADQAATVVGGPYLLLAGGNMAGAQNLARATVASHATTADIWGAAGNQIDFTGTTTVTEFPNAPQGGTERTLICAAASSFIAGANMLIDGVAGAATLTCAAGDTVIVRAISATQFKLTRIKADGTAQVVTSTPEILTPSNTSPSDSATDIGEKPTLTGSEYYSLYGVVMAASQWQVSTVSDFATTVISTGDRAGTSLTYDVSSGVLSVSTQYYWRVRYKDSNGIYSDWSTAFSFTTASAFPDYIATPAATPAAFGDAFEGGFYTGMLWNELVQSPTSTAIATGSKEFTVPSMTGAPIVYEGQALEVRSRANPANKMIGTVTFAQGTTLTIDVTSVGGSGTFTDWSIMSRYRYIVAPKSSGESAALAYKNANDAAPSACGTLTEGRKATLAMVAAGDATVYPAAHYCNNLVIGGFNDFELPARDVVELFWRNLKPTTDDNYTTANRPTAATPDYENLGSYGDTANTHGLNNNSSPQGAAYTSGSPAQTAATAFRTGGAEAFEYGSAFYWSSSEYSASYAWRQNWGASYPGYQSNNGKTNAYRVRAVRRSII